VPGAVVNSDLLPRDLPFLPSERGDESLKPPPAAHGAGFLIEAEWRNLLSVICFAISSVAENEEQYGRQRPRAERYPKPKLARSSTLPGHLCGKGYRRKKNDENENRPRVHLTVSDCHRNHNTEPALKCWTSAKSEAASVGGL
jgi:hypothetical protein